MNGLILIIMKKQKVLRLKNIENISQKVPDYTVIMTEILGYKNYKLFRKYRFAKYFKQAHYLITAARQIDPKTVDLDTSCTIKLPNTIDNITFRAMMELQSVFGTYTPEKDFGDFVALIIAIACYQQNNEGNYDSNCEQFKKFKEEILNLPIWQMIGLYNWIDKNLVDSQLMWSKRFMSVEVEDKDYEQAGGHRMGQFNVLNTIKNICADFNCTYDEAWQVSYALTQTNSYAKATSNHIQDQMRQIKELKMNKSKKKYS